MVNKAQYCFILRLVFEPNGIRNGQDLGLIFFARSVGFDSLHGVEFENFGEVRRVNIFKLVVANILVDKFSVVGNIILCVSDEEERDFLPKIFEDDVIFDEGLFLQLQVEPVHGSVCEVKKESFGFGGNPEEALYVLIEKHMN